MSAINYEVIKHTEGKKINYSDIRQNMFISCECHFESEAASISKLIIKF